MAVELDKEKKMANLGNLGRGLSQLGQHHRLTKILRTGVIVMSGLLASVGFNCNFNPVSIGLARPALAQEAAEDYFQKGFAALRDNPDAAISLFNLAIQLDPNHANAYFFRGIAYSFKKEYGPAFRDLDKAISLAPDNPSYYVTRGKIYEETGDHQKARQDRQKAQAITESKKGGS
jgi:tetratricopeptide (TPR) repeat protein